jgi:hypothetical protein
MAQTVSSLGSAFTTTAGDKTITATPAVGDYIIIVVANSGYTGVVVASDNNADGFGSNATSNISGGYSLLTSVLKAASVDTMQIYVRNRPIGSATSTIFTLPGASSTGGGGQVFKVTGATMFGLAGIRQFASQANQAASGTPAPVLASAALTTNSLIGAVFNATSPATMTPRTSWTESIDLGYSTPTTGIETMFRNGGETGTTQTWGGTSASAFSSVVIEIDGSTPTPTITNLDQYDSDGVTSIPTGGYVSGGISPGANLEFDMVPYKETIQYDELAAKVEARAVGTSFTNVATTTALSTYYDTLEPIGMRGACFVYDTIRQRYIMTFGANGSTSHNEVWELRFINGRAKWRQLAPTGTKPTIRYQGGGVFDAVNNRVITVFGFTTVDTNELWSLSFASSAEGAWSQLTAFTGTAPLARSNVTQTVVNDPTNQCFYVFAGWGASFYNGVYKFVYTTTAGVWSTLKADASASPAPVGVRNSLAVLDVNNGRIITFGGNTNSTTGVVNTLSAFQINTTTWTTLSPTGGPPAARERHWGYFDTVNRCMVMGMGDDSNTANVKQEIWKLDLTTTNGTWSRIDRAQDDAGQMATGMYLCNAQWNPDMACGIIWAGGVDVTADLQHHVMLIDSKDMGNSRVDFYGAMYNHFMRPMDATNTVYDSDGGEALAIGGYSQIQDNASYLISGGHVTDVFSYNYTNNAWRVATEGYKSFAHREGICSSYDTVGQRVIAFGGLWGAGATNKGTFNDTWEIKRDINGNYIVRRMAPTGTLPGARWLGNSIYDAARNRILITCGSNGGTANFNDVWQLDLSSGDGAWSQLTPTGTPPTAKWASAVANDTTNKIAYIFGGATSAGEGTYVNTFSKLDYSSATPAWTALSSTSAPTGRRSLGMAIDIPNGKIITFGGYDGTNVLADTNIYTISGNSWNGSLTLGTAPSIRRSHGSYWDPVQSKMIITHGRIPTGPWLGDTWAFTPNYGTPNSSTWVNLSPKHYIRGAVQAPSPSAAYHWQAWVTDVTQSADSAKASYGANLETVTDYTTALGVTVDPSNAVYVKPNLQIQVI